MKLHILVNAAPSTESAYTAYAFADAALKQGHSISQVFFYQDGVHTASTLLTPPSEEPNLHTLWATLAQTHHFDLLVCVAAALRRGVLSDQEAKQYVKPAHTVGAPFQITGLGQLMTAISQVDRCITFND
jgi:tRNA 2-thiouridine synthesizing protein D